MISRPRNSGVRPGDVGLDADNAAPVEQQLRDDRPAGDGQIAAPADRRIEIADRRGGALVRPVAHRHRRVAVAEVAVHVGDEGNLPLLRIGVQRLRQRRPILGWRAADRDRPVAAMQIVGEIGVGFELAEERQNVVPAPAGGAERLPLRIVIGRPAQRHHAHDGGAATHDAPLRERDLRRIVALPPMHLQVRPHVGVVVIGDRIGIAHVRGLFARRRVLPGFEQQDAPA